MPRTRDRDAMTRRRKAFGQAHREHLARAVASAQDLVIATGIQSREGRQPKEAERRAGQAESEGVPPMLVDIAAVHEYGAPELSIPERSYLRSTADRERLKWGGAFARIIGLHAAGDTGKATSALSVLMSSMTSAVRNTIRRRIDPPLSEMTAVDSTRRAGGAEPVPLIATGQLINSIRTAIVSATFGSRDEG